MADRDYYEVLGVARDASAEQIKKAYRALARKHHPDANPGDKTAEAKFKEIQGAYDILSDPEKKAQFDQFGHAAFSGFNPYGPRSGGSEWASRQAGPGGFENIDLGSFFNQQGGPGMSAEAGGGGIFDEILTRMRGGGQGGGQRRRAPAREPEAAEASIAIPFLTAVRGGETAIELDRGTGGRESKVIKIPPGLESGSKIRLKGQGGDGIDLIITVSVEPHPYFTRDGRNLSVEVPISAAEAILGARIEVPTLDGTKTMPIPPGTSSGQKLRLRGQGVPASKSQPEGDLYIVPRVVVPKGIDEESRKLIEEFAARNPSRPRDGLW
ncbi:DnaJ C-terminal domain-containing protein [Tundrisphaera sp. TA3]|uniref:DnaJ C-terminal domain-containing protein n=1 Tax=Tundrisphaera sp. TA3 TaxID=3435775 RepID=UPI003EBE6FDD